MRADERCRRLAPCSGSNREFSRVRLRCLATGADILGMQLVLVMSAPPHACLVFVASLWSAVEPLVHAPEPIQSARKGGIGVVNDAILERECAHARSLAYVRRHVGSSHGRIVRDGIS